MLASWGSLLGSESDLSSLLVIIPALNEADTVGSVVSAVLDQLDAEVLVVDDGSTDATADEAIAAGATVISHPFNLGVGAALRTGFRYARDGSFDAAVQVDADGQHEVADAQRLVEAVTVGGADLAVGSRFAKGYRVSFGRRVSMRALSRRVTRYLGVPVTDTTSGFRSFSRDAITRFAVAYPSAYLSDTVEALLLAGDYGLEVVELPVQMHERQGGQASAGLGRSAYHMVRLLLVIGLHKFRRPLAGAAGGP